MKVARRNLKGFSLVEVLVFVSALTVALVALIGSVTYSSLVLSDARHKLFATRYNEELAEWLKFQRQYYQYQTIAQKSSVQGSSYCFNTNDLQWPTNLGYCTANDFSLDNFYKRELTLRLDEAAGQINVEITTSYWLLNRQKQIKLLLVFNQYDL